MGVITDFIMQGTGMSAVTGGWQKSIATLTGFDIQGIKETLQSLSQPTLCFIPIKSEMLTMRCMADIGNSMIITQATQQKEYVTDNAAPRPRVWTGRGYIESLLPLGELGLMIKPTLLLQQSILEAAADSRQPVKFKTETGEVFDVLIQDLQITSLEKGSNVKMVTYTVQEVKMLENAILTEGGAEALGSTAAASIPKRAVVNLGKNKMLGAGITNTASGLLGIDVLGGNLL